MAADLKLSPGRNPFQAGAHGKFQVAGWTDPEPLIEWDITVPEEEACSVDVLLRREGTAGDHRRRGPDRARDGILAGGGAWLDAALPKHGRSQPPQSSCE